VKERFLTKDEFLLKDCQPADCVYFLREGTLRVEKELKLLKRNQWPSSAKTERLRRTVKNSVLYKV
jgi:hypothetical protein